MIAFSLGTSKYDADPKPRTAPNFAEFCKILDAARAPRKHGAYICGPMNGNGHRCADGALPRSWLAVDADRIAVESLTEWRMWWTRFSGIAWPTHSSTPDAPRERVIIELDRDAARDECIEIGRVLLEDIAVEFGDAVLVDKSTFRTEQPVYLAPPRVPLPRYYGEPLAVDSYLANAQAQPPTPPPTIEPGGKISLNRNDFLSRRAFGMRKEGMGVDSIERILQAINTERCDPPLSEDEVRGIAAGKKIVRPAPTPREALQPPESAAGIALGDFYAHMPSHSYLFAPTRELWPAASVNGRIPAVIEGKAKLRPSDWLDLNRPVDQTVWHPDEPELIADQVMQVSGWAPHTGAVVFNLYRPPEDIPGNPELAGPWIEHVRRVYPDEAAHIVSWLAHRLQRPGDKCNHALVLGGAQGIGKDTILEPVKGGIGPWNWQDVAPPQMLGRFNGWAKAVVVRVNEARDLGDADRFSFYDHSKAYIAAPPDVIRVDEKNLREHYVANVCGVIITTNHKTDGLYLPADDRRHFVAWSEARREEFEQGYWTALYAWYARGGIGHVVAHLRAVDLSLFDPKAPPPKTAAFWAVVQSGEAPESGELRDVLDECRNPDALTLVDLIEAAERLKLFELSAEVKDRRNRRAMPHKLERVGYVPVRNPDADDGLFKINGRRQAVYTKRGLPAAAQVKAARLVSRVS